MGNFSRVCETKFDQNLIKQKSCTTFEQDKVSTCNQTPQQSLKSFNIKAIRVFLLSKKTPEVNTWTCRWARLCFETTSKAKLLYVRLRKWKVVTWWCFVRFHILRFFTFTSSLCCKKIGWTLDILTVAKNMFLS